MSEKDVAKPFLLQMVDQTLQAVAKPGVTTDAARAAMSQVCPDCPNNRPGVCEPQLVDLIEVVINEGGRAERTGQRNVPNVLVNDIWTYEGWVPLLNSCPLVDNGNVFTAAAQVIK